ncbi:hypothetical protein [Streptosporangium sp. NPDC002524]|uniref:hypothetical protein n=1 Tax=Streptosporangium sp. NPDC002524 TaxID=3154537 RepID=UPI00332227BA
MGWDVVTWAALFASVAAVVSSVGHFHRAKRSALAAQASADEAEKAADEAEKAAAVAAAALMVARRAAARRTR